MTDHTITLPSAPTPAGIESAFASSFAHLQNSVEMPPWLRELKEQAWARYIELPLPSRLEERWRFGSVRRLENFENFSVSQEIPNAPELISRSSQLHHSAGKIVLVDDHLVLHEEVEPELREKGVVFTTLIQAAESHPELVREHLLKDSTDLGSQKFESLNLALMRNGVFLYVPDGVEIETPLVVYHWSRSPESALFPHSLFVCGKHAKANLVEFQEHAVREQAHLAISRSHLSAEDESRPQHRIIQNWSPQTESMQLNTASVGGRVDSKQVMVNIGSVYARQEIHGRIFGSESNVELYSLSLSKAEQEVDQRTLQTHLAPNSRSDLLYKNALSDDSRTIFSGLIIVDEGAQQTDAYQTNNNLMLSETAEANSLPGLEIGANDVKCSHGATTGRIDDTNMFYFLARGIPRRKAEELIVFGFFEEIIGKFENEELAEYVRHLVQGKFSA